MLIMGNTAKTRGCFHEIHRAHDKSPDYTLGAGAYITFTATRLPEAPGKDPYFISNISINQSELYQVVPCFGNNNYIYGFGHNPGSVVGVDLTVFLVDSDSKGFGGGLKKLHEFYRNHRLSGPENHGTIGISLGTLFLKGYLIGMQSRTSMPEINVQTLSLECLVAEVQ